MDRPGPTSRVHSAEAETDGCEFQEREGVAVEIFPILGEAATTVEPCDGAFDDQDAAIAILNAGGMDDGMQQQTQRIDENMPLLALDQLARIEPVWIDAGPPFSALFTL
jgi:hypothetical protein